MAALQDMGPERATRASAPRAGARASAEAWAETWVPTILRLGVVVGVRRDLGLSGTCCPWRLQPSRADSQVPCIKVPPTARSWQGGIVLQRIEQTAYDLSEQVRVLQGLSGRDVRLRSCPALS